MSEIFHFKSFSVVKNGVRCQVNMDRFSKQFNDAQFWLDSQIMTDMNPFMPMREGTFIQVTRSMSAAFAGTGTVFAGSPPMGRFLYEGKVMVDPVTKSPWARKGAKKVLAEDGRLLDFSKGAHPTAAGHWFDAAKEAHGAAWVDGVKKRAGGG